MYTYFRSKYFSYLLGIFLLILVTVGLFWSFFWKGEIPIPGDILIGTYYPWMNETWGFAVSPPVKNPPMSDVVSLMYPWRKLVFEYIQQGQLPLWDASSFLGQSLIGNFQAAIFNPFNLLFLLPISFSFAWGIQVVTQPFLAMSFSFILFKRWKLFLPAALAGALGYGLSAPMLVWMEYNLLGFLIVLLPLSLLVVDVFIRQSKARWLMGISFVTTLGIFFGYIQMLYYVLFFSFLYGLVLSYSRRRPYTNMIKWTVIFSFSVLLGLCLASIQLLPGFETLGLSIRNLDVVAASNAVTYLPYSHLITGLAADFFGNSATYNYYGQGSYESFAFYTSIALLPFVFWSFADSANRRLSIVMVIFVLGSLLLALSGPLAWLVQSLSFLGLKGSVSSRVLFVFSFGFSALGALGLQAVLDKKAKAFQLKSLIAIAAIFGVLLGILMIWWWFNQLIISVEYKDFLAIHLTNVKIALRNTLLPFGVCFIATIVLFLIRRFSVAVWIVCLLIVVDMFRFSSKYVPFTAAELVFPETKTIEYLKNIPQPYRLAIEKGELMTANTWSVYGLQSVTGYNILLPRSTADFVSVLNNGKTGEENARFLDIKNFNSPLLDQVNAQYILALKRQIGSPEAEGKLSHLIDTNKFEQVFQEGPVVILKNKLSLERFFVPEKVLYAEKNQIYLSLAQPTVDPFTVYVDQPDQFINSPLSQCQLQLQSYRQQSYDFQSDCGGASLLAVTETLQPGWKVKVNGQSQPLLKINNQFIGIHLPAGKSQIALYYLPDSFLVGAGLSAIGVFIAGLMWFFLPKLKMVLLSKP
jgi:hypothetical protein